MAGKPGRSGPRTGVPQHNGTMIARLPVGELPLTMRRQLIGARKYRKDLETLVAEAKGGVNSTDAHLINEAVTAEIHAHVCRWLLRTRLEKMTVSDIAKCSGEILKAKTVRNRAVSQLGLDRDAMEDAIDALYSVHPAADNEEAAVEPS